MTLARKSFGVTYQPCIVRRTMVTDGGDTIHPSSSERKQSNVKLQMPQQDLVLHVYGNDKCLPD